MYITNVCGTKPELRKQDAIRVTAAVSMATRMIGLEQFFVNCDSANF